MRLCAVCNATGGLYRMAEMLILRTAEREVGLLLLEAKDYTFTIIEAPLASKCA